MAKQREEEAPRTATMAEAILAAQRAMGALGRDANNAHHGYDYVSAEKMVSESRRALHEAGLTLDRPMARIDIGTNPPTLLCRMRLSHPLSGAMLEADWNWPVVEGKGRPLDKAFAGALTTSLSYYLRDLLMIPKADTNEVDRRDDSEHDPVARAPIGVSGAVALRKRLAANSVDDDKLRNYIASNRGGELPPEDMAEWPKEWLAKIGEWIKEGMPE